MRRVVWLTLALFLSFLCVAMSLPVTSVYVSTQLGLSNALAGLAVGVPFASTIVTRGMAGKMSDHRGGKYCMIRGLLVYSTAALVCLAASWPGFPATTAYGVLIVGRLLLGLGESLTMVGLLSWGFGIMGPQASGRVIAWVGMGMYGAFAVGSPVGLALLSLRPPISCKGTAGSAARAGTKASRTSRPSCNGTARRSTPRPWRCLPTGLQGDRRAS